MAKGWLDNYGTKENENNSSVSLPEGFVGMGNNTKGRDYSPAWGGQFQNGGKTKSKYWTEKDIPAANWKKFIKQHPGAIGMDPNRTDKNDQHLPIYADKNTSGYILQSAQFDKISTTSSMLQLDDILLLSSVYVTHIALPPIITVIVVPTVIGISPYNKSLLVYNWFPVLQSTNTLTLTQLNISSNITNVAWP